MSGSGSKRYRPAPFCFRLSESERAELQSRARGIPLGTYVRQVVFGESQQRRRPVAGTHSPDAARLGQLLGLLGRSHLANNLNQIAKAVHLGSLPVTEELETELRQACADVADMRRALLLALGVVRAGGEEPIALRQNFGASAREAAE